MRCRFRYVLERDERNVTLRLFEQHGRCFGEVIGPRRIAAERGIVDRSVKVSPTDPDAAFAAAIRLANTEDVELVVSGDTGLWDDSWGVLEFESRQARSSPVHQRRVAAE